MEEQVVRVSSKGQVVLPAKVRKKLHVEEGRTLAVAVQDGIILLKPVTSLAELHGVLKGTKINTKKAIARLREEWDVGR